MSFLKAFKNNDVTTVTTIKNKVVTPQPTENVLVTTVTTVTTKKNKVETKNKIKNNDFLAKCYTPLGNLLLVKVDDMAHKEYLERVNPEPSVKEIN